MYSSYSTLNQSGSGSGSAELRNNLFHRSYFGAIDVPTSNVALNVYNNLFRGGELNLSYTSMSASWAIYNNLFDNATISISGSGNAPSDSNNGYIGTMQLPGGGVSVGTGDYQSGVQGRWYYPTSGGNLSTLINAGNVSAAGAQLYHYTTRTDHTKDTGNVDIGYHFVAIDANGAIDTDGDGIPDYLEDRDGDGIADTGEFSWTAMSNGATTTPGLILYTPLIQ